MFAILAAIVAAVGLFGGHIFALNPVLPVHRAAPAVGPVRGPVPVAAVVTRDHIVSIRLTAAERAAMARLGDRPSDVIRRLLRDAARPAFWPLPVTAATHASGHVVWMDGTVGQTWPQPVTR